MQTPNKKTGRKEWQPTEDQHNLIKAKYATYYSSTTMTKSRLANNFGISVPIFVRYCEKAGIRPKQPKDHYTRDYTGYYRVPVPDKLNCPTVLLVPPHRDPAKAKAKYMKRHKARLENKPWDQTRRK